jgi:hypothetical protein
MRPLVEAPQEARAERVRRTPAIEAVRVAMVRHLEETIHPAAKAIKETAPTPVRVTPAEALARAAAVAAVAAVVVQAVAVVVQVVAAVVQAAAVVVQEAAVGRAARPAADRGAAAAVQPEASAVPEVSVSDLTRTRPLRRRPLNSKCSSSNVAARFLRARAQRPGTNSQSADRSAISSDNTNGQSGPAYRATLQSARAILRISQGEQRVLIFRVKTSIWNSLSSVSPKSASHFSCAA